MWTYIIVGITFALYIGIAIWTRAGSTKEFYVAGGGVSSLANGMATARLDVGSLIYLDGRSDLIYGLRWSRLPHGMDRRIRLAGLTPCALPSEVWEVYCARLYW